MSEYLLEDINLSNEPPPPFQGSMDDKTMTRKRQALFLRQTLLIAHRFSQNPVTPTMLASALPWLEREQYDDLAVERNAVGNCGYLLCEKPYTPSIHQAYRIRCATRQVFDTQQRKPYCSDWCFSAAMHIRKQISKEPSWCRYITPRRVTLYSKRRTGVPGKVVLDALRELRLTEDENGNLSSDSDLCSTVSENSNTDPNNLDSDDEVPENQLTTNPPCDQFGNAGDRETFWGKWVVLPQNNLVKERSNNLLQDDYPSLQGEQHTDFQPSPDLVSTDVFGSILKRMYEWLTPVAYTQLTQFIQPADEITPELCNLLNENEKVSNDSSVLPLIDSVSVLTIRRQLWMDEFLPSLRCLFNRLSVDEHPILTQLTNAVQHFQLTNKNIHVHRSQRSLIALLLLRLMAEAQPSLKILLSDKSKLPDLLLSFSRESAQLFEQELVKQITKHFTNDKSS